MSADIFSRIIIYLWLAFCVIWMLGAITVKQSVQRQSPISRLAQSAPLFAGFFLLFARNIQFRVLTQRILPESAAVMWVGLALATAGIAFAVWARLWIGANWSGAVTIKQQHELIQSGPYRIVRHPIYSGMLLGFIGTAIVYGQLRCFVGLPLAVLGFALKLRLEEHFMIQQFGNAYVQYKHRVKALVPFVV